MTRPVFGRDTDPVASKSWNLPTPAERDAQWRKELVAWGRKHRACQCECPDCDKAGIHEAHDHTDEAGQP